MMKGIVSVLSALVGGIAGASVAGSIFNKKTVEANQYANKHLAIMQVMNQWIIAKQNNKSLADYFKANGYKTVAIYGMSYLGERLVDELAGSEVEIKYAIDRNADNVFAEFEVLKPDEDLPSVDVIVITPIFYFDEIENGLAEKVDSDIVSIEDVIYGV